MEQFDSSEEASSRVLEQQQRNDEQQCPTDSVLQQSKPTPDSSRSDKKETSHVVWPRIKNVLGQTANQSTTLLYTGKTQQRSFMQEVDQ